MPDLSMQGGYTKNLQILITYFFFLLKFVSILINMDISDNKIAVNTKIYISIKLLWATSNLKTLKTKSAKFIWHFSTL